MNDVDEVLKQVLDMEWAGWIAWSTLTAVKLGTPHPSDTRGTESAITYGLMQWDGSSWQLTPRGQQLEEAILFVAQGQQGSVATSLIAIERLEEPPPAEMRDKILTAAVSYAAEGWLLQRAPGRGLHEWFDYVPTSLCRVLAAWRESEMVINLEQLVEGVRLSEAALMLLRFGADLRALSVLDNEIGGLIMSDMFRDGMIRRLEHLREEAVTLHGILDFFCERSSSVIENMRRFDAQRAPKD